MADGERSPPPRWPRWIVTAFAVRLQDAVALDAVCDDLADVVEKALEPAHVSVWIRAGAPQ